MALKYGDKMDVVWLCWVFSMIHVDDKHSLPLSKKCKVYSPFGPCTGSAPSPTPPLWRTKGLLGPWWGSSQNRGVRTCLHFTSITAVIKAKRRQWQRQDTQPSSERDKQKSCWNYTQQMFFNAINLNVFFFLSYKLCISCHRHTHHQQLTLHH